MIFFFFHVSFLLAPFRWAVGGWCALPKKKKSSPQRAPPTLLSSAVFFLARLRFLPSGGWRVDRPTSNIKRPLQARTLYENARPFHFSANAVAARAALRFGGCVGPLLVAGSSGRLLRVSGGARSRAVSQLDVELTTNGHRREIVSAVMNVAIEDLSARLLLFWYIIRYLVYYNLVVLLVRSSCKIYIYDASLHI